MLRSITKLLPGRESKPHAFLDREAGQPAQLGMRRRAVAGPQGRDRPHAVGRERHWPLQDFPQRLDAKPRQREKPWRPPAVRSSAVPLPPVPEVLRPCVRGWRCSGHSGHTVRPSSSHREPQTLSHFSLDLPPDFAHPANRPRNPTLGGSELVLLTSEPADKGARFHPDAWFRAQVSDDRRGIQLMHLGELPRPEPVIRVVPGTVVPGAQGDGRPVR